MRATVRRVALTPFQPFVALPVIRRVSFHLKRIGGGVDVHFFRTLLVAIAGIVFVAALLVTVVEAEKRSVPGLADSFYWAVTTVIGSGDASYVDTAPGFVIGWFLAFFGVAIVAALTAALVGFVIDYLLKEGQGMGAAGFKDHIVVCGWTPQPASSSRSFGVTSSRRRSSSSTTATPTRRARASTSSRAT